MSININHATDTITSGVSGVSIPIKVNSTNTLLGRSTAGSGPAEEITCTAAGRALLDDADASEQRTTLGLGSAATLNAGTSANNLVQLDGTGKLPAVDGSQLTNLPSGGGGSSGATLSDFFMLMGA